MNHRIQAAASRSFLPSGISAPQRGLAFRFGFLARITVLALGGMGVIGPAIAPLAWAQSAATGVISGRVQNASTGNYLNNARVRVAGSNREAFTNQFGEYR